MPHSPLIIDPENPRAIAGCFLKSTGAVLLYQAGVYYEWDGACYRELSDADIRAKLYSFLELCKETGSKKRKPGEFKPTRYKVNNVEDALRALVNLPSSKRAPAWLNTDQPVIDPFDLIAFPNGLLHLPTRVLLDATPDFFTLTALPFAYDTDAPRPTHWLSFIEGLWPGDEASISTFQEWSGLLLTSNTRFQKILLIVGPPRSGKGVWSRTIRQLVGHKNYVALTLRSLADRFGTQALIGKSVAVISDARLSNRVDSGAIAEKLLAISGEDSPAVQRKCLPDWQGELSSRFTILTNELPNLADASGALSSRLIVLKLTKSHLGEEDLELEPRFVPELPGILLWALDGLDRLLQRGHFIQPDSGHELIEQMSELSSPIRVFLDERCEIGEGLEVERSVLFAAWKGWCETTGHQTGNASTFGRDLHAALPGLTSGWQGSARVYRRLRLRKQESRAISLV